MKIAKKVCSFVLCLAIVTCSIVTGYAATTNTDITNYVSGRNYNGGTIPSQDSINYSGRNANIVTSFPDRASGDKALQLNVTQSGENAISVSNPCDYTMRTYTDKWFRNSTSFSYDFKVEAFDATYINASGKDEGKIFGFDVRDSANGLNGRYMGYSKKTTATTDGKIGDATFEVGKWYNLKIVFQYKMHAYSAVLKNLETGATTVVADLEPINENAVGMEYAYVEFYRPCTVSIDNLRLGEEVGFGIYPWAITQNASGTIADGAAVSYLDNKICVGVPDYAKSAALYLDGVKQVDITPGSGSNGLYKLGYNPSFIGEHTLCLEMTDINDNVYKDTYTFKDNTAYSAVVSREYDFSGTTKTSVENGIGGGFVNGNNVTYAWGVDGTAEFAYKDQAVNNFYMRGTFNGITYGTLSATCKMKLMQTNETVVFSYESRTQDSSTKRENKVTIFGNDGKIAGTNIEYAADTWYDVTFVYNTAAGTAEVFVNGIYVGTSTYTQNHGIYGFLVYMPFNNSDTKYVFDHFKTAIYNDAPGAITSISSSKGNTSYETIIADADAIKVNLSDAVSANAISADDITLEADGQPISFGEISYDANAKVLTIPVTNLPPLSNASLTLGTNVALSDGNTYALPCRYNFAVGMPTATTVYDFVITQNSNTYSASADLYYNGSTDRDVIIYIAGYNGDCLEELNGSEYPVKNGKNEITVSKTFDEVTSVKAFVWYKDTLEPLCVSLPN